VYGWRVGSGADIPLHDSDPEATLPFRAVVAVPGQDETVDSPPTPRLQDPARAETRAEDQKPGTLPFGTVLPLSPQPQSIRSYEGETVDAPAPQVWVAKTPQAAGGGLSAESSELGPGSRLEGGFEVGSALGPDPLGQWWGAVHGQFGPCLVLALDKAQAASEGPRLLIAARVAMGVPPDPRLELPVGTGAVPAPWIAIRNQQTSSLDEILRGGAKALRPLRWARDLAGGLVALHAYGVSHGEVCLANARIPTQGAARWGRIALRTKAGPPEALPPELQPGASPTRNADLYAFGAVLEALAPHVAERWRAEPLAQLAGELRSDARPSAKKTLDRLTRLLESPPPTQKLHPVLWALAGALVGAALGALSTWLALS
jgi:hypothetical protein